MTIKQLTLTNIKGITRDVPLEPLTIVQGPNATGKTAILDAVRFVLLGYVPGSAKTNAGQFELSSGAKMEAIARFDNGKTIARNLTQTAASIRAGGAGDDTLITPCLDPSLYFGLSESARIEYIFQHCGISEEKDYSTAAIVSRIADKITTEEVTADWEEARKSVLDSVRKKLDEAADLPIQEQFEQAAEHARDKYRAANQAANDSQGAVRTLEELRLSSETTFGSIPQWTEKRKAAHAALETLSAKGATLAARAQEADRAQRRKDSLLREQETLMVKTYKADTAAVIAAEAELARAKDALQIAEKSVTGEVPDIAKLAAEAEKAQKAFIQASGDLEIRASELRCCQNELAALESAESCPHCHSTGEGWKAILLAGINKRLATATKEVEAKTEAKAAKLAERDKLAKILEEARGVYEAAQRARLTVTNAQMAVTNAQNKVTMSKTAVDQVKQSATADEARLLAIETDLRAIEEVKQPDASEMQEVTAATTTNRAIVRECDNALEVANRVRNDLQRAEQAAQAHTKHSLLRDCWKKAGVAIVEMKSDIVADAFKSLLNQANRIGEVFLKSPLAYNAERNELGRWEGHVFVTHRTFSGMEKTVTYIALAVALAAKAPFRIILLDEVNNFAESNQEAILNVLETLLNRGAIDQAIVVRPTDVSLSAPEGWAVVETFTK